MAICKENPSTYTSNVANIYQGFNGAMQIADRRNVGVDKLNENFYLSKDTSDIFRNMFYRPSIALDKLDNSFNGINKSFDKIITSLDEVCNSVHEFKDDVVRDLIDSVQRLSDSVDKTQWHYDYEFAQGSRNC